METVIRLNVSELNISLLNKIKEFVGEKKNIDVTISLHEYDTEYVDDLNRSIELANREQDLISMTMEEFIEYIPRRK